MIPVHVAAEKNIKNAAVNNIMKIFNLSFEKSVGAVIFRRTKSGEREFLLLHYPSGHWDFPKGHVEKNETEDQTLRREVAEETGIIELNIVAGFKDYIRYFYQAKGNEREDRIKNGNGLNIFKKVLYYIAETKEASIIISDEHIDFEWLNYENSVARITFENGKNILRKANIFLEKNLEN
jgi:8-oxo-dGTP pyrophosphatase MutT (NUDIX family)